MLLGPDAPAHRVAGYALDIAMTDAPDLGSGDGAARERVAGVGGAVVVEPQDLAEMGPRVLGRGLLGSGVSAGTDRG
jgi:hypothetical protein